MIPLPPLPKELGEHGACRDANPELFWPVTEFTLLAKAKIAEAKQVCHACPVLADCRSYGLMAEPEGIWGGLTAMERAEIRRAGAARTTAAAEQDHEEAVA